MALPQEIIDKIKQFEGFRPNAYRDPGSANGLPITIGYGQTRRQGRPIKLGETITEQEAERWLLAELARIEGVVDRLVKVPLSAYQRGALVSFTYNVGDTAFEKSTLLRELNKGNYDAVPGQLARWVYNDKKRMDGLVNRRAAEAGIWARGEFVASAPVAAEAPKPASTLDALIKDPAGLSGIGSALAVVVGAIANQPILQIAAVAFIGVLLWRFVLARKKESQ